MDVKFNDLNPGFKTNDDVLQRRPGGGFTGPWNAKFEIIYVDTNSAIVLVRGKQGSCTVELQDLNRDSFDGSMFFREETLVDAIAQSRLS